MTESVDGGEIELHVVQVVEHVAVVLEVWKDSVVVEDVVVALEDGMKLGPEEVRKGSVVVDKEWKPPVGGMVWRLEVASDVLVVELELVEEALM